MNRTFKFRIWDKQYQKMRYRGDGRAGDIVTCIYEIHNSEQMPVMQYTGLKDAKGTEIFEGDIVTIINWYSLIDKGVVVFGLYDDGESYETEKHIGWFIRFKQGFNVNYPNNPRHEYESTLIDCAEKIEIIGNIYENPNLLTNENMETQSFNS